jgi:hypothetical protein
MKVEAKYVVLEWSPLSKEISGHSEEDLLRK